MDGQLREELERRLPPDALHASSPSSLGSEPSRRGRRVDRIEPTPRWRRRRSPRDTSSRVLLGGALEASPVCLLD